jgi:hypothetical protein
MIHYIRSLPHEKLMEILYIYENNSDRYNEYKKYDCWDSIFVVDDFIWFHNTQYSFPCSYDKIVKIIKNIDRKDKLKNILDDQY